MNDRGPCIAAPLSLSLLSSAGRAVRQEVKSILSPLPAASQQCPPSMIERRPKRKGKSKLASFKYGREDAVAKGRKPALKFQKKFVLIDYMGPVAPQAFGLKESYILMRGMLPEIEVSASESEVRLYIRDTIRDSDKTLAACLSTDFEFMEASGKCIFVPAHQADFEWTGKAVKQLAGAGAIYVRLTIATSNDEDGEHSDSSSESADAVKIMKVEDTGTFYGCSKHYSIIKIHCSPPPQPSP